MKRATAWPMVPLGEVLTKSEEQAEIQPDREYSRVTVRLWGSGVVLRDEVSGTQIAAKRQYVVQPGQFILSRIDARNGALGLVPDFLDGAVVSSDFPAFDIDRQRLEPRFLEWVSKTRDFVDLCRAVSEGTTNRVRLKVDRFLATEIPLPPLEEQRRIVARIEELAAKVEAARALRQEAMDQAGVLFTSALNQIWQDRSDWTVRPIGEIASTVSGQVDPKIEPYATLPHINGEVVEPGTCRLLRTYRLAKEDGVASGKYHFQTGAILYSKIRPYLRKAVQIPFEGICSADIYAFQWIDPAVEPRFLMYSLVSPQFTEYANLRSGRTRIPKLNQKQLFAFRMAYPDLPEQRRIVAYLDDLQARVDAVKQHQAATAAALNALLPSILDQAFKGEL